MSDLSPVLADGDDQRPAPDTGAPALGGPAVDGLLFYTDRFQIKSMPPPDRRSHLSATEAMTMRRNILIANGSHPFGGPLRKPEGETCGSCGHCTSVEYGKRYYKCALMRASWTKGPGSDLRRKWPACSKWAARQVASSAPVPVPTGGPTNA